MAAKAQIAPEEYLRMRVEDRPWPELADGEIRERSLPTFLHGWIQSILCQLLRQFGLLAVSELHLNLGNGEFRVADVAAYRNRPSKDRPDECPLITVEVLSPDDRHMDVVRKCEEYFKWGVPNIWVVSPDLHLLHTYSQAGLSNVEAFELQEYGIRITFPELVAGLPQN